MTTWRTMTSRERYARYAQLAEQKAADNDNNLPERRLDGERRRQENEDYWLAQERARYGLTPQQQGKPLSKMIA